MATKKKSHVEKTAVSADAFEKVRGQWVTLSASELVTLNADLDLAATAGLVLVDRARKPGRAERFAGLEGDYVEKNLVANLALVCEAAQHVVVESVREEAVATGVKVDASVVDRATELKTRMLKCVAYSLEGNEPAEKEIADIRRGTGYLDQSRDLTRLSALYKTHHTVLVDDKRNYRATDHDDAIDVAQQIRDQYRAAQSTENVFVSFRPKAFTEIQRLYNEVRDTALFIFRAQPEVKAEFEALRTAMARVKGRSGGSGVEEGESPDEPAEEGNGEQGGGND